jgi:hypothetical protein
MHFKISQMGFLILGCHWQICGRRTFATKLKVKLVTQQGSVRQQAADSAHSVGNS